jgi:hypothetical protein
MTDVSRLNQLSIQLTLSEPLRVNNGLRQGDPLSCLLFNAALEKAVCESIQLTGHILNKSVQVLAYADDTHIIARSKMP